MTSETTNTVTHRAAGPLVELLDALAGNDVAIVDLTNRLSSETPTLRLPEPFANLIDFSLETVSEYDEPGHSGSTRISTRVSTSVRISTPPSTG